MYKFDHVEYKFVGLRGLNELGNYVGIKGEKYYFMKEDNLFKPITSNTSLQEMFLKLEDLGKVDIYINRQVVAEEGDGFEVDKLEGGVNDNQSFSGGEDFDDSDSEYEYKMDEHADEEEVGESKDDWVFEGELIDDDVKKSDEENKGKGRVEDTDVEGARVEDTDFGEWSGKENIVYSDDDLNSNKRSDVDETKGENFPMFNPSFIFELSFELGMIFSTKDELRTAIQSHAIKTKRSIMFTKNDRVRVHAKCFDKECKWRTHACQLRGECTFQIRDYVPNHTCNITFNVRHVKSSWQKMLQ